MGEKDISEKLLEDYNDVFADIINVLLFHGERLVQSEDLTDKKLRSVYKADGKLHEIERDVGKNWDYNTLRIACLGLENQTNIDADMPLRVISYDGAEYRTQLLSDNPSPTGENRAIMNIEREAYTMCDVLDRIEQRGIDKGLSQGIDIGLNKGLEILDHIQSGETPESIATTLGMNIEKVNQFIKKYKKMN